MKRCCAWLSAGLLVGLCWGGSAPGSAAAHGRPIAVSVEAPATVAAGARVTVRGAVRAHGALRADLQLRQGRRWRSVRSARVRRRGYRLSVAAPRTPGLMHVRVRIRRGRHVVATTRQRTIRVRRRPAPTPPPGAAGAPVPQPAGPPASGVPPAPLPSAPGPVTHPPAPAPGASDSVPADTVMYGTQDIASVRAGTGGQAEVTFPKGVTAPLVGGHVSIPAGGDLPDGMLARVASSAAGADGSHTAMLEPAAVDEVFQDADLTLDEDALPQLTDATGRAVARRAAGPAKLLPAPSDFQCQSNGQPIDGSTVVEPAVDGPVSITFGGVHATGRVQPGGAFDVTLSGSVTLKLGYEATQAFDCSLKEAFMRSHTLRYQFAGWGGVPITVALHPAIEFHVDAHGTMTLSQTHTFTLRLERSGGGGVDVTPSDPSSAVTKSFAAGLHAELFMGATASIGIGGTFGGVTLEAGLEGSLGPKFVADTKSACLTLAVSLRARLAVFLHMFSKHWEKQLAEAETQPRTLVDTCPATEQSVVSAISIGAAAPTQSWPRGGVRFNFTMRVPHGLDLWGSYYNEVCFDDDGDRVLTGGGVLVDDYGVSELPPGDETFVWVRDQDYAGFPSHAHCRLWELSLKDLAGHVVHYGQTSVPDDDGFDFPIAGADWTTPDFGQSPASPRSL